MHSFVYYPGSRNFIKSREAELTFWVITSMGYHQSTGYSINIDFWFSKHQALRLKTHFFNLLFLLRVLIIYFEVSHQSPPQLRNYSGWFDVPFLYWFSAQGDERRQESWDKDTYKEWKTYQLIGKYYPTTIMSLYQITFHKASWV